MKLSSCLAIVVICSVRANSLNSVAYLSGQEEEAAVVTARGSLYRSKASVMRSNPWPPLRADHEGEDIKLEYEDNLDAGDAAMSETRIAQVPVAAAAVVANATGNVTTNVAANGTTVVTIYKEKDTGSASTAIGVMLLGMVTFIMSLFYAVHFPDADVQHATWLTLSEAISLFCAVLAFTSFKDIMVLQFGESGGHHAGAPDIKSMILSFLRLLIAFWGVQFLLMKYRRTDLPLKAWGSIGGNVVAFAAIDSLGMIQQFSPFRDNPANAFLGFVIGAFMIMCMCLSAHIVRNYVMTYEDGIIKEHEMKWNDQCKHVENQFASICLGLLLSIVVRYGISGSLPAIWGSPHNKSQDQVNTLFGVSLGFAVPVFALSLTVAALENHRGSMPGIVRAGKVMQLILSMSMGWSLVFCGQWEFWSASHGKGVGMGDKMTARMVDALIFSYLSFSFIIALDFLADRMQMARGGFNAVSNAFVLGLGIAWQGAFSEAVNALSHHFEDKTTRAYMDVLMTICLCAVVLPAWVMYMLPKALAGPQPLEGDKDKDKDKDKKKTDQGEAGNAEEGEKTEATAEAAAAEEVLPQAGKTTFCNACGSPFEEGAEFCQNCGGKRAVETKEAALEEPKSAAAPAAAASFGGKAGGVGGGKAAASGGKGARGSFSGKASAAEPAAAPQQVDEWGTSGAQTWDQQESPEHDDGWNVAGGQEAHGQGEASF